MVNKFAYPYRNFNDFLLLIEYEKENSSQHLNEESCENLKLYTRNYTRCLWNLILPFPFEQDLGKRSSRKSKFLRRKTWKHIPDYIAEMYNKKNFEEQ